MDVEKRPPKYPFVCCENGNPVDTKKVFRTKAKAEEHKKHNQTVDRIPWEDGMVVQDD